MTAASVLELDASDPLARFREAFQLPPGLIYLDGHSLGPPPRAALQRVNEVAEQEWAEGLVRSWNAHDWIGAAQRIGGKIAGLIGVEPDEVLVADSTTVNIYKLAVAALKARPERRIALATSGDFPTDLYALQGAVETLGGGRRMVLVPAERVAEALTEDVAVLVLTHVHYKSAEIRDMAAITAQAREAGALVVWDLSHSTGAVEVDLNGAGAELAVGCGYKYLNGGPGAPAFLFVSRRLKDQLRSPLSGWMGHAEPFAFKDAYEPAAGVARFACGTPPMLSLLALESGVELALEAGAADAAAKLRALGDLFIELIEDGPAAAELRFASPRDSARRGGHVAYRHPRGYEIIQALIARGVIGDFREPDVLRFGFSPLYLSYSDVAQAAESLGRVMAERAHLDPALSVRAKVT